MCKVLGTTPGMGRALVVLIRFIRSLSFQRPAGCPAACPLPRASEAMSSSSSELEAEGPPRWELAGFQASKA